MLAFVGVNVSPHALATQGLSSPNSALWTSETGARTAGICSSHHRERRTVLPAVSELVGASEETGGVFDPMGFATDEV